MGAFQLGKLGAVKTSCSCNSCGNRVDSNISDVKPRFQSVLILHNEVCLSTPTPLWNRSSYAVPLCSAHICSLIMQAHSSSYQQLSIHRRYSELKIKKIRLPKQKIAFVLLSTYNGWEVNNVLIFVQPQKTIKQRPLAKNFASGRGYCFHNHKQAKYRRPILVNKQQKRLHYFNCYTFA